MSVQSYRQIVIVRTVDTDVLVLAVNLLDKLQALTEETNHLLVAFGTGVNLRYLAAHDIARSFVKGAALALPAFHTFTRCDTCDASMTRERRRPSTPGNVFLK